VTSKTLADLKLDPRLRAALEAAREQLTARFDIDELVLYGSVARGEADDESDVDLLVILKQPADRQVEDEISRTIFHINLGHDTTLSALVVDREKWDHGMISAMPIHYEIEEDGIPL
jgi:uncharacterized protein